MKILIIRPDAIGDVVLMIPMINTIKLNFPDAKIYTLQSTYTQSILDNHPHIEEVLIDPKASMRNLADFLRPLSFDVVVHSYFEPHYAAAAKLAGIPIRIGDGNKVGLRPYLTHPIKLNFRQLLYHETEQNIRLIKALNPFILPDPKMDIRIRLESFEEVLSILKDCGWEGESLIGIHPSTGGGNRAWSSTKYAHLIDQLHKETPHQVVLSGFGKKDGELIDSITSKCKKQPLILFEKTTLEQLKAVIKKCLVYVGTDTGPTHIAAGLDVPVVSISPTKFVKALRWGPWRTPHQVVGHGRGCDVVCNPHKCTLPNCLDLIPVQEVLDAIHLLIKTPEKRTIEDDKKHWMKQAITVAFVPTSESTDQSMETLKKQASKDGLEWVVLSSKNWLSIFLKLIKLDVGLVHIDGEKIPFYWPVLCQLSALKQYVPPIIVSRSTLPKSKSLIDAYFEAYMLYYVGYGT